MFTDGLLLPKGSVLSHTAAARFWGLPLPVGCDERVHVTLPMCRGRWAQTSALVHRRDLTPADVASTNGVALTSPLRTVLDLPSALSLGASVAAADAALRMGLVGRAELLRATEAVFGRGARAVRAMGRLADPSADSPLESQVRVLLTLADLAPPRTQYVITAQRRVIARVDFAWPEWFVALQADGFEYHSDRAAYRKDREQDNDFKRLGWLVPRVTWEHVHGRPTYVSDLVRSLIVSRRSRAA